jgi:hypothetical protein
LHAIGKALSEIADKFQRRFAVAIADIAGLAGLDFKLYHYRASRHLGNAVFSASTRGHPGNVG